MKGSPLPAPALPSWEEKKWVYGMSLPMSQGVRSSDSVSAKVSNVGPGHKGALTLEEQA